MSTHKHIDKICCVAVIFSLLLTAIFMNGEQFGLQAASRVLGYETRLFDTSKVHTIDIVMDDWDSFIDTCQSEEYSSCAIVIDGEAYKNVGIRGKGNTSLSNVASMDSERYSFKVEFDQYDGTQSYHGLDKLSLNNIIQDNTYMKDYLVYRMMESFGVDAPLCSYVYITVNGEDWGLYLAVEGVEDSFLQRNYGNDYGELYKPDSMSFGGGRGNGKDFNMEDFDFDFDSEDGFSFGGRGNGANGDAEAVMPESDGSADAAMPESESGATGGEDAVMPESSGGATGGEDAVMPESSGGATGDVNTAAETSEADESEAGAAMQAPASGRMPEGMTMPEGGADMQMPMNGSADGSADGQMQMPANGSADGQMQIPANGSTDGQMQMPMNGSADGQMMQMPEGMELPDGMTMPEGMELPDGMTMSENMEDFQAQMEEFAGNFDRNMGGGFGMGSSDVMLQYIDDDPSSYSNIFDNAKTDITEEDQKRLIASLKSLSSYENIEEIINIEEVIRYFVVHNFVVNDDSYTGSMIHNYYLYEEDGQLSMIPWDYNLAFGTFTGANASSAVNDSIDFSDGSMEDRPMLNWIFEDEEYTEMYYQYFEEFISEYFDSGYVSELITQTKELIAPYVEKDPTKFCTYEEFETGADTLKQFCELRAESVSAQLAGTDTTVDASSITLSDMGTMQTGGMGGGMNMPGGMGGGMNMPGGMGGNFDMPSMGDNFDPGSMGNFDASSMGDFDPSSMGDFDMSSMGSFDPSSMGNFDPSSMGDFDPSSMGGSFGGRGGMGMQGNMPNQNEAEPQSETTAS